MTYQAKTKGGQRLIKIAELWIPAHNNMSPHRVAKNIRKTVKRVERKGGFLK